MDLTEQISPNDHRIESFVVTEEYTAQYMGSGDFKVLATPAMILFMEQTAHRLLEEHLSRENSSIGYQVDVRHLAPCPLGSDLNVKAEVVSITGHKVTLSVRAWTAHKEIGEGTHRRVVIDPKRFMRRLSSKI